MEGLAAKPDAAAARGEHDARLDYEIVVIGAGFAGIGAAIKLQQARLNDFVILEQAADLGGTWRDNTYPGVAVDITSLTYSFSFAQNPGWSRLFAPGDEIRRYADRCADDYGLRDHMRFNTRVRRATFDEAENLWRIESSTGTITARCIITACGGLTQPKAPDVDGLDRFEGKVMHTARWDHSYDVKGKRVAVIGTGASAVQVIPAIAPTVGRLHVFQRTPPWVLPKPDREIPRWMSWLFRTVPATQTGLRLLMSTLTELRLGHRPHPLPAAPHLRSPHRSAVHTAPAAAGVGPRVEGQAHTPVRLRLQAPVLFQRLLSGADEGVSQPIEHVTPTGIRTADGVTRAVDTLILATGFKVFELGSMPPFEVFGRGGRELGRFWHEHRYQAYEGTTVPRFPNLFMVLGPYSTTGSSWFAMVEAQADHAVRCLTEARRRQATTVEIKTKPHDEFFRDVLRRRQNTVLFSDRCATVNSYYFDRHGDAPFLRPSASLERWWRSRHFNLDHYQYS